MGLAPASRRKWQPTPAFLPGKSQGQRSLVGCRLWGRTESDMTEEIPLGWPWEAPTSPRVARESWGLRSSHCRATSFFLRFITLLPAFPPTLPVPHSPVKPNEGSSSWKSFSLSLLSVLLILLG